MTIADRNAAIAAQLATFGENIDRAEDFCNTNAGKWVIGYEPGICLNAETKALTGFVFATLFDRPDYDMIVRNGHKDVAKWYRIEDMTVIYQNHVAHCRADFQQMVAAL